jgi:hypothetical protein
VKKFFSKFGWYIFIAIIILIPLSIMLLEIISALRAIGGGSIIKGIIVAPFALVGAINFFRGFCAVIERDAETYDFDKGWKGSVYLIITILGYAALFYVIGDRI